MGEHIGKPPPLKRMGRIVVHAAAIACVAWPSAAVGQVVVLGRVTGNGAVVANARVGIDALNLQALTTDSGSYRLTVPGAGTVRISIRALGFQPASHQIQLAANDTTIADFILVAVPQELDSVTVAAPAPVVRGKMRAFEERRRFGLGRFYTREALAGHEDRTLANTLRLAGLQLRARPDRCGGGYAVATGRGGGTPVACVEPACYASIFLDGVRYWVPGQGIPPNINEFLVRDLEGIEVYRGMSDMPIQFQVYGSSCGAVVLWTRVGGGR